MCKRFCCISKYAIILANIHFHKIMSNHLPTEWLPTLGVIKLPNFCPTSGWKIPHWDVCICIFLISNEVDFYFTSLISMCVSISGKCHLMSFPHFAIVPAVFSLLICRNPSVDINPYSVIGVVSFPSLWLELSHYFCVFWWIKVPNEI